MGVERSQELFRRRAQRQKLDVRGLGLGLQRGCIKGKNRARRNTRDVGGLGLGVEGNTKDSLFNTNEMLGKCWWFWAEGPKGMIKTGGLENRDKIGDKQQGVLRTQWEDLKKQFAKRLVFQDKSLLKSNIQKMGWN